jgi:diguanylate cyclase (GGDEF)-like protein
MIELYQFALNSIDIGIILIDCNQTIVFWNKCMEVISQIRHDDALGKKLPEVCSVFKKKRYQDILESVIVKNQSRFCSSKLHNSFVLPLSGCSSNIKQNMTIEPTTINNCVYALIQIDDITDEVSNEHKLTSLINELKRGYLEVKESEEVNRQLAEMDQLTKIANRHGISQYIDALFRMNVNLSSYALMFIDLDGFKLVNDTYGHLMGDNLLIEVADILKRKIRKNDLVARLGGDEFLILLSSVVTKESLEVVGQKLITEISRPIQIEGLTVHVTASIGIAMYDPDIVDTNSFIKKADDAMYRAKRKGKNMFTF